MKKILYIFTALLALAVISCGEKDSPNQEPSGPSGGDQPSSGTEISEISIPEKLSMDVDWTDGQLLVVTLTPASASMSDVTASITSGEDVISIEKATGGFRVKPKKVGSAVVKVSASKGSATSKTCTVTVTEPGISQAVELTSISLGSVSSVELADLTPKGESEIALIPVTLEPSTAGISDVLVSSSDSDVHAELINDGSLKLLVTIPSNTTHAETKVRDAVVTLKAKKGPANSAKLDVGVRGHVIGLSLTVPGKYLESGEVHFTYGEKVKLSPTFTKTGTLKSGGDKITYTCGSGVSVTSSNEIYCSSSSSVTGAGSSTYVKAQCGFSETLEIMVHTYSVPTDITVSSGIPEDLGNAFKVGGNYILTVTVTPSTARQYVTPSCSLGTDYLTISDTYNTGKKFDIVPKKSTESREKIIFTAGTKTVEWPFYINDYHPGDVKIGDYVYRTSTGGVRRSDGGLRAVGNGQAWIRKNTVLPDTKSGESLLGVVFDTGLTFVSDLPSDMKVGVKGENGVAVHVGVVALMDANNGQSCTWSTGGNTITTSWSPITPSFTSSNTYKIYLAHKGKKSSLAFFNLIENFANQKPLPSGTTPWMMPSYLDFEHMGNFAKVLQGNGVALSGTYWTGCCEGSSLAGTAKWENNTCTMGKQYFSTGQKLRPVFFL